MVPLEDLGFVAITGCPCSGTTSLARLLSEAINSTAGGHTICRTVDLPELVRFGRHHDLLTISAINEMSSDDVFSRVWSKWLVSVSEKATTLPYRQTVILDGIPSDPVHARIFDGMERIKIVHQTAPDELILDTVGSRNINPASVMPKIARYREKFVPVLNKMNGRVIHLERSRPLAERVSRIFNELREMGRKSPVEFIALNRLTVAVAKRNSHAVNRMICALEAA